MIISSFEDLFGYNAVDNVRRLQREVDRMFSRESASSGREFPLVNVYSNGEGLTVTSELPGIDANDLDITVVGRVLTIKGERKSEPLAENEKYLRRERAVGSFVRTLELPFAIESEKVEASYSKGVLSIKLPRAERDRPKKIAVN